MTVAHGPEEVRLRLDRRGALRVVREVEERAESTAQSARPMIAPPCSTPPDVQRSSPQASRSTTSSGEAETSSSPSLLPNGMAWLSASVSIRVGAKLSQTRNWCLAPQSCQVLSRNRTMRAATSSPASSWTKWPAFPIVSAGSAPGISSAISRPPRREDRIGVAEEDERRLLPLLHRLADREHRGSVRMLGSVGTCSGNMIGPAFDSAWETARLGGHRLVGKPSDTRRPDQPTGLEVAASRAHDVAKPKPHFSAHGRRRRRC